MSILSTFICSLSGRLLFSRQNPPYYLSPLSKREIENHMVYFIRHFNKNSQLSLIESSTNRYLYLPLNANSIYIVILTSINSNIVCDMKILKLSHRVVVDICKEVNEKSIIEKGIDIVMGLDEIVFNGLQYAKNIYDVITNVKMIKIDIKEIKEIQRKQREKERAAMIKQMEEMEKMERKEEKNEKKQIKIEHKIHLNEKFEFVQLEKPNVFKTPSGKVVLLSSKVKTIEENKLIKGMTLTKSK